MTAIAGMLIDGRPILFGDAFLSWPGDPRTFTVPAIGDVPANAHGKQPFWLLQKVAIVTDRCAVAWAGSLANAAEVLRDLRTELQREEWGGDHIQAFIAGHPRTDESVAFVGWHVDAEGGFTRIVHNAEQLDAGRLGEMHVAGSDIEVFRQLVEREHRSRPSGTECAPEIRAWQIAAGFVAKLLQIELRAGSRAPTLQNLFGGVYEVAVFDGRAFRKLPFTHIIGSADVSSDPRNFGLTVDLVVKQEYAGETLRVRSARFDLGVSEVGSNVADSQRFDVHSIFDVTPAHFESPEPSTLANITFDSTTFSIGLMVYNVDMRCWSGEFTEFHEYALEGPPLRFKDVADNRIRLGINVDFCSRIRRQLILATCGTDIGPEVHNDWYLAAGDGEKNST